LRHLDLAQALAARATLGHLEKLGLFLKKSIAHRGLGGQGF